MSLELQRELVSLRSGDQTFTVFARRTNKTWTALAKHLLKRWRAPTAVDTDDMVQQLLFAAWVFLPKWDEARGTPLHKFIVYNAVDKAKKWLHKQRGAYRRDDNSPSRLELPISTLGLEPHEEERMMGRISVESCQEKEMLRREAIRALRSDDLPFMYYQRSADIEVAAARMYESNNARLALGIDSFEHALALVERSIDHAAAGAA